MMRAVNRDRHKTARFYHPAGRDIGHIGEVVTQLITRSRHNLQIFVFFSDRKRTTI